MSTTSTAPVLSRFLLGGAVAGSASASANGVVLAVTRAATGIQLDQPTFVSIAVSSFVPCLLGALGYFGLSRFTEKATTIFVAVTSIITVASFEGAFRQTLPDGTPKPHGFDVLVMPMHVVVGLAAVLLVPRFARPRAPPSQRRVRRGSP